MGFWDDLFKAKTDLGPHPFLFQFDKPDASRDYNLLTLRERLLRR